MKVVVSSVLTALLICVVSTFKFVTDPDNQILPFARANIHKKLKDIILGLDVTQFITSWALVIAVGVSYSKDDD